MNGRMTVPTFIIGGPGRTGTGWLLTCLREHPQVYLPAEELQFFSWNYQKGFDWYSDWFDDREEKAIGEKSPSYLIVPDVPKRIHQWNSDVKLIFSFRNPIERAYSHYCGALKAGSVSEEVDEVLNIGSKFVEQGRYFHHLSRYMDLFPAENIKCMIFDDLKNDPAGYFTEACAFIAVDPSFRPSMVERKFGHRKPRPRFQKLWKGLQSASRWFANNSRIGSRLVRYARKKDLMRWFHRLNAGASFPEMSDAKREELADFYEEDVANLSEYLDRDLSHWLHVR
jgi:hypothetical protein